MGVRGRDMGLGCPPPAASTVEMGVLGLGCPSEVVMLRAR